MLQKLTTFLGALLLALVLTAAPALAQTFSGDNSGGTTWARSTTLGTGASGSCSVAVPTTYPYATNSFTVASDGDYAVQVDWTGYDGYLMLHEGSFNPTDQCLNQIGRDDDFGGLGSSRIESIALTAGTTYIVVATTFSSTNPGGAYDGFVEALDPPPVDEAGDIVNDAAADAVGQTSINGVIGDNADEDCYAIEITDAANFTAGVDSLAPDGDSQLFLFDASLEGIASDDDDGPGLLSLLDSTDVADAGIVNGDYFLCITAFNNDPLNSDASSIFPFGGSLPAPAAGDSTLADWTNGGSVAAPSTYAITLTGVTASGPNYDLMASGVPATVAQGGSFTVSFSVTNNTASPVTGDLFYTASPGGVNSQVFANQTVQANSTRSGTYVQNVPGNAPPGTYTYTVRIGNFPGLTVDSEVFSVMVTGASRDANLDELLVQAKKTGDLSIYEETVKSSMLNAGEWTNSAVVWQQEESTLSAAARAEVGAYPNPFARSTEIGFELDKASDVSLVIYDVRGREVAHLVDGTLEAGQHSVTFDAASLPSGVYVYRLQAGSQTETGRMTLLQ